MAQPSERKNIPFFPDLFLAELMVTAVILTLLFLATGLGYSAPLEDQADPFLTPPNAQAPWYFLFLQGLLKITPKSVGAFFVPVGIVAFLFGLPFLFKGPMTARGRRISLTVVVLVVVAWIGLTYIGTPAFGIE